MKVGLFFTAGEDAADIADVARAAEAAGFGSLWVGEHVLLPETYDPVYPASPDGKPPEYAGMLSSPLLALARAAAVTERIRVGTGVCLLPLREPITLAKDIATLDRDSCGRFLFGVGAGWMREETEIMGGDFPRRWRQIADSIAAMKTLWRDDISQHDGPYTRFPAVDMRPKPAQRPYPPILLGGASPRIFDRVASWGDGWIPGVTSVSEFREGREQLFSAARAQDRDPSSLVLVPFGLPGTLRTRAETEELAELGADHATIWLDARDERVFDEIEQLARDLL